MVFRGWIWGNGEMLVKGYKQRALRWLSSGVLMYSVMTIIPDYMCQGCYLKYYHCTFIKWEACEKVGLQTLLW